MKKELSLAAIAAALIISSAQPAFAEEKNSNEIFYGQEQMAVSNTSDTAAAQSVEQSAVQPSVQPVEQPTEQPVEQPVDQPVAQPTEGCTVTPEPTETPSATEDTEQETEDSDGNEENTSDITPTPETVPQTPETSTEGPEPSDETTEDEKTEGTSSKNTSKPANRTTSTQGAYRPYTQSTSHSPEPKEIEFGSFPEEYKEILEECMEGWGSEVTSERVSIIENAVSLYGVEYSMSCRNAPSVENPKYLDCSSFVGQAYWRAGLYDKETAYWCTGTFASEFEQISASEAIPGDIAQISWNPGGMGSSEHVGIYIGTVGDTKYFIHCTRGGGLDGVVVNSYSGFAYFGRSPEL